METDPATTLVVMAKAPAPGRSKTRLCPPCTPDQAAAIAEAALADTLETVAGVAARRRVVALEGPPGDWLPADIDVIVQRGEGLAERLSSVCEDVEGPFLLIGMDTPQVGAADLAGAMALLERDGTDAVLGLAPDGGWWAIGLRTPDPAVFHGVPMSTDRTGDRQLARLRELGLAVTLLAELRDVDHWDDAVAVATGARPGAFARAVDAVAATL